MGTLRKKRTGSIGAGKSKRSKQVKKMVGDHLSKRSLKEGSGIKISYRRRKERREYQEEIKGKHDVAKGRSSRYGPPRLGERESSAVTQYTLL